MGARSSRSFVPRPASMTRSARERIQQSVPEQVRCRRAVRTVLTASSVWRPQPIRGPLGARPDRPGGSGALSRQAARPQPGHPVRRDLRRTRGCHGQHQELDRLQKQVVSLSMQAKELCLQSVWALVQHWKRAIRIRRGIRGTRRSMPARSRRLRDFPAAAVAIENAAMLHDLGKIGVPDHVLQTIVRSRRRKRRCSDRCRC